MKSFKKLNLLITVSLIGLGSPVLADMNDFWNTNGMYESADDYSAQNPYSSAYGRHQIILSNWVSLGVVEPGATSWDNAQFTDYARSAGVSSYYDLGNTQAGYALQEATAGALAQQMYNGLSNNTQSYVGQNVNGVTLNEAGLLRGAWYLGPGGMNQWAASGFTAEGLAALDPNGAILAANSVSSYEELNARIMNQMAGFGGVDITDLTSGTYVVGGGAYSGASSLEECDPEVQQGLAELGQQRVENTVAVAQDQTLGFSSLEEPMGIMSCVDFAFSGGIDIFFSVPNLSNILSGLKDYACQQLNQMVGNQISQLQGALSSTINQSLQIPGFGPISGLGGVSVQFNPNSTGINVYQGNAVPTFGGSSIGGGYGGSGGSGGSGTGDGLDRLLRY